MNVRVALVPLLVVLAHVVSRVPARADGIVGSASVYRTWTDDQGRAALAKLVTQTAAHVHLQRGQRVYVIPIQRLSDRDQSYLRQSGFRTVAGTAGSQPLVFPVSYQPPSEERFDPVAEEALSPVQKSGERFDPVAEDAQSPIQKAEERFDPVGEEPSVSETPTTAPLQNGTVQVGVCGCHSTQYCSARSRCIRVLRCWRLSFWHCCRFLR